jgi:hypothetical protein
MKTRKEYRNYRMFTNVYPYFLEKYFIIEQTPGLLKRAEQIVKWSCSYVQFKSSIRWFVRIILFLEKVNFWIRKGNWKRKIKS